MPIIDNGPIFDADHYSESEHSNTWQFEEGTMTCSNCGAMFYEEIIDLCGGHIPNYCPNCGTKMSSEIIFNENDNTIKRNREK
jgi:NAD-dependent SIR2 family protein deacetylase